MTQALIVNDIHAGPTRAGGTTLASAIALRDYLQVEFRSLIMAHTDKDLVVNGDLLDSFTIDVRELLQVYQTLVEWLHASDEDLYLVRGNHDASAKGQKISSFEFLCNILVNQFPGRVRITHGQLRNLRGDLWAIGHSDNQDLFNMELAKAEEQIDGPATLLLHCNYDNHFAEESDHSLNLSEEAARRLTDKGIQLVLGHEHQKRTIVQPGASIFVAGNQFPSSVSDCLAHGAAQKDGCKYAHILYEDNDLVPLETWSRVGKFIQADWTELDEIEDGQFIRVTGTATAESAAQVISNISKLRQKSKAFVVTNGVKISSGAAFDELGELAAEAVTKFNVKEALFAEFTVEEVRVLEGVLND